jgi:superfamily II RNA helicase
MIMIVEQLVECELAGETEVLGENLPQRHLVYHKFHKT